MPLETGSYVSDLVSTNPTGTDGLSQGDDHLRLIKLALKSTFPNFTAAALTSTQAQLDAAASAVNTNGVSVLADAGAHFKTNTGDGLKNPTAGELDLVAGNNTVAKFKSDKSTEFQGDVTVPSINKIVGPGAIPVGGSIPWFSDTLPDASYGTYAWLNGQAVSRTTYAVAFALLGTAYGSGDGTTTFNLPDTRDNVLVGKGTMGATTAAGRITNFVTSTLGNLFGECLHLLGLSEIPSHNHTLTDPGHYHKVQNSNVSTGGASNTRLMNGVGGLTTELDTEIATTGITIAPAGGGASHNNVQPSLICNWVMRIA